MLQNHQLKALTRSTHVICCQQNNHYGCSFFTNRDLEVIMFYISNHVIAFLSSMQSQDMDVITVDPVHVVVRHLIDLLHSFRKILQFITNIIVHAMSCTKNIPLHTRTFFCH